MLIYCAALSKAPVYTPQNRVSQQAKHVTYPPPTNVSLTNWLPDGLTTTAINRSVTQSNYDSATGLLGIGDLTQGASAVVTQAPR